MARRKKTGVCCICGQTGELSFEHVPPKAAYNKITVIEYEWEQHVQNRKSKGRSRQGGAGAYTLCEQCNNNTGPWYGDEYVKWARSCHDIMLLWNRYNITQGSVCLHNLSQKTDRGGAAPRSQRLREIHPAWTTSGTGSLSGARPAAP